MLIGKVNNLGQLCHGAVGPGVSPDLLTLRMLQALAGLFDSIKITAGGEFHPALRIQEHYSSTRNHANGEMCFRADFS